MSKHLPNVKVSITEVEVVKTELVKAYTVTMNEEQAGILLDVLGQLASGSELSPVYRAIKEAGVARKKSSIDIFAPQRVQYDPW